VLARPKKGFGTPLGKWFRAELRDLLADHLAPARVRSQGFFRPEAVARLLDDHLRGRRDNRKLLFNLLAFTLWWESVGRGRARGGGGGEGGGRGGPAPADARTAAAFAESWNRVGEGSVYTREQFLDWLAPIEPHEIRGRSVVELGFGNGSLLVHVAACGPSRL